MSCAKGRDSGRLTRRPPGVAQEMYYRHLYATVQPTLEQRCDSWDNYCALFNVILSSNINMQARGPRSWLPPSLCAREWTGKARKLTCCTLLRSQSQSRA